jgi:NAD-dependent SIR2 family protein deacetylase
MLDQVIEAADWIAKADALLIAAGAGMGVDSGLPDFRGPQGFWKAYPPYARLGLNFIELANPRWFREDPELAWGFYGHRMMLYRQTEPHAGFHILRRWAEQKPHGAFVFTSNVDGHFQRAGFSPERVVEAHGAVHAMQCTRTCGVGIFPSDSHQVEIDPETMRARPPLPKCPRCDSLARPNVLMFGDWGWDDALATSQHQRLEDWLGRVAGSELAIIELGAGTAVPTVRHFCEQIACHAVAPLIRINPREPDVPPGHVGIAMGALDAIQRIDEACSRRLLELPPR